MKATYNKLSLTDIEELAKLVGEQKLFTEFVDIEGYSYDESPLLERFMPQVVVKPTDTALIARILAFA
jgi:FAD/FMN-containing dehydrogenase